MAVWLATPIMPLWDIGLCMVGTYFMYVRKTA